MAATPYDAEEDWDEDEQLDLSQDDRLPWLESAEEEDAAGGFDTVRLVLLGVLALAVLGAVLGAIWFVTNKTSDEPSADGSLIAAPTEPYKTKPADEGGKVFAGTGDSSFAVGEGQTRESKLADKPVSVAGPSIATTLDDETRPASTTSSSQPSTPPQTVGVAVQVGAFPRRQDAEAAWAALLRQTEALSGVSHRVVEAQVDIGRVYRLQAMARDRAAANQLCAALKADGLACFVK
ncbi:SPOR domain-containing protein [Erythrobacter mangrovi]|uniref:SPOR domain-containing protein n=1 Tax=Erythrobacter mangrovi TaxID=2739433 RepID=A0A7D3X9L3_9SPHN|nr:SPOR domain-containing protein [Erythrobacter mangrovi]QKG70170.1 SPOR domain-containing protein [Erythrobacter mangrovi]